MDDEKKKNEPFEDIDNVFVFEPPQMMAMSYMTLENGKWVIKYDWIPTYIQRR